LKMTAPAAVAAPTPCGRTQATLDALLRDSGYGETERAFKMYFFRNDQGTKKFPTRTDLDDDVARCKECGRTIGEHPAVEVAAATPESFSVLALRAALDESLPPAMAKYELQKFMNSRLGICDAASASSAKRTNDKGWVRGRREAFGHRCLVTETPAPRGEPLAGEKQHEFKCAHIVQRKIKNSEYWMNFFDLTVEELDSDGNILVLRSDVESAFDRLDFCFLPVAGFNRFEVAWMPPLRLTVATPGQPRPFDYKTEVTIPEFVSRRMLMIQAMDAHRGRRCVFDPAPWESLDPRPQSTAPLVRKWLDGQLGQKPQVMPEQEVDDDA